LGSKRDSSWDYLSYDRYLSSLGSIEFLCWSFSVCSLTCLARNPLHRSCYPRMLHCKTPLFKETQSARQNPRVWQLARLYAYFSSLRQANRLTTRVLSRPGNRTGVIHCHALVHSHRVLPQVQDHTKPATSSQPIRTH
jgi:hypothetical protein